jgi:ribosome-associated protein
VQELRISGDSIRLGQLLKLGGVVESGGGGKELVAGGAVLVNGELETRRGRRLRDGDVVEVEGRELRVRANF